MQEPLNFSRTTAYSASQEIAARLLNSLKANNCGASTSATLNFDLRASSLPRDGSAGGADVEQMPYPLLSNPWATFPSAAFLAAAAAAAISMKSTPTNNSTGRLRETMGVKTASGAYVHENSISEPAFLSRDVPMGSTSIDSNISKPPGQADIFANHGLEGNSCSTSQENRCNPKPGEQGRRSRVVIHQFGDAEDHFSKALRNLHVKSAGEYEMAVRTTQEKRVWTFDDVGGRVEASATSPSFEAQNIADLAVEKHFEKSLATFHAKQAAAAKAASETNSFTVPSSKTIMDLSVPRNQPPFSPSSTTSSSSTNSSSDGSMLLSPREDNGGPSFNPKKKWLAQYDDDEGARSRVGRKNGNWSLDDNTWNSKATTASSSIEKRSQSCPLLLHLRPRSAEGFSHCEANSNNVTKRLELSQEAATQSSMASLQISQRGFSSLARTISLEVPSLGNSIGFFDDEDEAVMASKSISARDSPVSSPIAASSGFFTDSTYSLDSSTLPVIAEAEYFSSNASMNSSFKARHLKALRESGVIMRQKERNFFASESEDVTESSVSPHGRCWPLRKRTASDASNLSCLKRSRSVVDTGSGEH